MANPKYCIIGGGLAGLGVAKCLAQAEIDFDIIEQEDDFGGNWYASRPSSKMYRSTHLISSKTNSQFNDFPMPQDYPVYPRHDLFLKYLKSVASHFDLYKRAHFEIRVLQVVPKDGDWQVSLSNGEDRTYKGVFVANGLLREPLYGQYPGKYTGETLHASQYVSPEVFANKRVLILGSGNSGCDIAVDAVPNATKVFQSTRRGYHYMPKFINGMATQDWLMGLGNQFKTASELSDFVQNTFKQAGFDGTDYGLPAPDHGIFECHPIMNSQILYHFGHGDVFWKPDIQSFEGKKVIFKDGTQETIDLILHATGYRTAFPFIGPSLLDQNRGISDLFLRSFHKTHDRLIFCGYINAPAGFGNLINAFGSLLVSYLKALDRETESIKKFRLLRLLSTPSLSRSHFINTPRHDAEADLWILLNFIAQLRNKFEEC